MVKSFSSTDSSGEEEESHQKQQQQIRRIGRGGSSDLQQHPHQQEHQPHHHQEQVEEHQLKRHQEVEEHSLKRHKEAIVQEEDLSSSDNDEENQQALKKKVESKFSTKQQEWQPKEQRQPPFEKDYTQKSFTGGEGEPNADDWAKRNQGARGKVSDLISRFNQGGDDGGKGNATKQDYGSGRQIGKIQQTKFR